MAFSDQEKLNAADKLSLQILGTANTDPGPQFWYNEAFPWVPTIPPDKIWTDFDTIPGAITTTEADNAVTANPTIMEKRKLRLTVRLESNNRAYLTRTTYNDNSTPLLGNGIQPSLIQYNGGPSNGYIARLYHGDPDSGGVEITTTQHGGTGGAPAWSFNYSAGILLVSTDQRSTFKTYYDTNGLWLVWYRYIGNSIIEIGGEADRIFITVTQASHGYPVGDILKPVRWDDVGGEWVLAQANDVETLAVGVMTKVLDVDQFEVTLAGRISYTHGLTNEEHYFLDDAVAGNVVSISPDISQPILFTLDSNSYVVIIERPFNIAGIEVDNPFDQTLNTGDDVIFNSVSIVNGSTKISRDGSNNMVLEDANAGAITLTALKSMRNIWIKALTQSPGNLTLSDATNWDAQYSFISGIRVKTASTDWDLYLCEDNTFNLTNLETRLLVSGKNGNYDITVAREYNSSSTNVYLKYVDNSGSNNADIYITGEARRH